jgi:hypothetical protein
LFGSSNLFHAIDCLQNLLVVSSQNPHFLFNMATKSAIEQIPCLIGQENYPIWSRHISNALSLLMMSDCAQSGYTVTTTILAAPIVGTTANQFIDAAAASKEVLNRASLCCQSSALINRSLLDSMVNHSFDVMNPRGLWDHLRTLYGTTGPSALYGMLKKALCLRIRKGVDPATDIATLGSVFTQMSTAGTTAILAEVPAILRSMILLNALPDDWEDVTRMYLANNNMLAAVTWDTVVTSINSEYQCQLLNKTKSYSNLPNYSLKMQSSQSGSNNVPASSFVAGQDGPWHICPGPPNACFSQGTNASAGGQTPMSKQACHHCNCATKKANYSQGGAPQGPPL